MRIFVTGATGFIGREFCRAATAAGHEVLGLARASSRLMPEGCLLAEGSLQDLPWQAIEAFRPEAVLHLAWIATPGVYLQSPENDVLVTLSERLFSGLVERGVRHIVGAGTCIEYAPSNQPLREGASPTGPTFPYSKGKLETCRRLEALAFASGVGWSWMRVFYPYGAGEHPGRLPSILMRGLSAGEPVELKTPASIKDYIHVSDAAGAMVAAIEQGTCGVINVGTGRGIQIRELAHTIASIVGADAGVIREAASPAHDYFPVTVADNSRLRAIGWAPRVSLSEGLAGLRLSLRT